MAIGKLLKKLKKAAKKLIPYFKKEYLDDSKIETYYIYNTYEKLESIYLFFKTKLEKEGEVEFKIIGG